MQSFTLSSSLGPFVDTHVPTSTSTTMSPSASPTGQAQGYGQSQGQYSGDLSTMLLQGWGMTPQDLMFYTGMALTVASLVMSMIWVETINYFEHFHHKDSRLVQMGVICGTFLATSVFAVNIAEVYEVAHHGATNFASIMRFAQFAEMYIKLVSGLFILAAGVYYSWRVWRLSGKKLIVIPIFAMLNVAALGMVLYVLAVGFNLPPIRFDTLRRMGPYFKDCEHSLKAWAYVVLGCDAITCLTLIVLLWRSKESLFNTETRLVRRLVALITESMVPPVIVLVIVASSKECVGSWTKIFTTLLPLLYWQSLLYALISRRSIRRLLDEKLASSGIDKMSGDSGAVFVHKPRDARAWHDKKEGGIGLSHIISEDGRPQGLPRGP